MCYILANQFRSNFIAILAWSIVQKQFSINIFRHMVGQRQTLIGQSFVRSSGLISLMIYNVYDIYIVIKYNEIRQQCFKTSNHNETTLIAFYPNKNFPYPCLINYCLEDHKSTLLIFLSISSRANAMSIQVDMVESDDFNLAIRKTWDSVSAQIQIE